jgi:hypothetical protein
MKKRTLSLAVALVLTLALAAPAAFAAEGEAVEYTADPNSWDWSGASFSITNVISQNDDINQKVFTCNAPAVVTILPDDFEESFDALRAFWCTWDEETGTEPEHDMLMYQGSTMEELMASEVSDTLDDDENTTYFYAPGSKHTFTVPGTYRVNYLGWESDEHNGSFTITVVGGGGEAPATPPAPEPTPSPAEDTAVSPTPSTVSVNGAAQSFEAYNIGGNNFFKLRDLAMVLNGTDKQFEVGYDDASKAITLTSGASYTAAGGELEPGDGAAKTAKPTPSTVTLDGEELALTAYNIGGNNFFKLRDLMQALDVYVGYDAATKAVTIDSTAGYVVE